MTNVNTVTELLEQAPASLDELLTAITPEIYTSLKLSVELRKWPDGARLSSEQIENAMQLIILYEHHNLPEELRTGRPLNQNCGNNSMSAAQAIDVIDEIDEIDNRGVQDS